MSTNDDVRTRREAVVREHMEAENRLDFDAVIDTFAHPRYELMASGEVFDGEAEVREYFRRSRAAFPDQRNENGVLRSTDDAVVVEFDLLGTRAGTEHAFRSRMLAIFEFEDDRIVCERVYYDTASITAQLK
ncbi:MAG: nuclear transport factor 2 family protein [Actinobacteria bacterium]|nr:nuclear transport factor 2 family protein [Actinomycetota bacterium]